MRRYPPRTPFFDIGGGNGLVSKALQTAGIATVLIEPGDQAVINARKRGVAGVVRATLGQLEIPERSLPSAGVFDVLEHIEDDRGWLARLHRLMAPGARLYVTVPAHAALWSAEDRRAGHYRRYSTGKIVRLLQASGYTLEYRTLLFSTHVLPVFFLRTLPGLLRRRSSPPERARLERIHLSRQKTAGRRLLRYLDRETRRIRDGKPIRWGSSHLLVART